MKEREFAKKNEANRIRISEVSQKKGKSEILKILKILNFKILKFWRSVKRFYENFNHQVEKGLF